MKLLSRSALASVTIFCCVMCFMVLDVEAVTQSAKSFDNRVMRERIATIFRETLKRGEGAIELNIVTKNSGLIGRQVAPRTFVPPSTEHVDEIRRYGDGAIPILTEYLDSGSGFEKYLAMRFLASIGGSGVVAPLRKVALVDASSSFRLTALLWLAVAPWDLAFPIIRNIAKNDTSSEVRQKANEILHQHVLNK